MTTTYKMGDMQKTRWQLAMRRWIQNRQKAQTLKSARVTDAKIRSMQVSEVYAAERTLKNSVAPNAESVIMHENDAKNDRLQNDNVDCEVSPSTRLFFEPSTCAFCGTVYTPKNDRAMYCRETCKQDAYLVRKAFKKGNAQAYILALGTNK